MAISKCQRRSREGSGIFQRSVDHPLHLALKLERMGASHLDLLPVVSRANVHLLRGVATRRDLLAQYGVADPSEAGNQER